MTTPDRISAAAHGAPGTSRGFGLELQAGRLELTVYPEEEGVPAPTLGQILEAASDFPVECHSRDVVAGAIERRDGAPIAIGRMEAPADAGDWSILLSPSHLFAYLVPGPAFTEAEPASGVEVCADEIREQLESLGVTNGVLEEVVAAFSPSGSIARVTTIAEGSRPVAGQNARIEFRFAATASHAPIIREDGSVDHHAMAQSLSVDAGAVLAVRVPPLKGIPGRDLFGNEISVAPVIDRELRPHMGKGTELQGDSLVAVAPGRPVFNGARVDVLAVLNIKGDVNYAVGNIRFNGDVVVGGDVRPGFVIQAEGSVTIRGIVDRATVVAGRDITAGGIVGGPQTTITAGGNVKAQYIHGATVTAEGTLDVNRELVGCTVTAGKIRTGSDGRIVGGDLTAQSEIVTGTLGSQQALTTLVAVLGAHDLKERGLHPPVIRAARAIHAGTQVRVGHNHLKVIDDHPGSSFWDFAGAITRLGPAAAPPKPEHAPMQTKSA